MAESKRTRILEYLRDTTLAAITTGNGYTYTVATIARGLQPIDALPDSSFPVLYIAKADEDRHNITHAGFISDMKVEIYGFVKRSGDTNNLQRDLDRLIKDVGNALGADRLLGGNMGVHALEVESITTDDGDADPYAAFLMVVKINYNTEDTNQ